MRTVALLFAFLVAFSVAAAEIPVGTPVFREAHGRQTAPSAASDGNRYFAVWIDQRLGVPALVGSRLDENGDALDENGILLLRNVSADAHPRVLWSGTSYVVLWGPYAVTALRVDRDGRVLDAPVMLLENGAYWMSAVSNGTRVVVAYIAFTQQSNRVRALTMDSDLHVLSDVAITEPGNYQAPSIAANDGGFLVAWAEIGQFATSTVHAVRLDASGSPVGSPRYIDSTWTPVVASDGHDWLLLSQPPPVAPNPPTLTARALSSDLSRLGNSYLFQSGAYSASPRIVWGGNAYKVLNLSWAGNWPWMNTVTSWSVDQQGQRTGEWEGLGSGTAYRDRTVFDAATNGNTALATWDDQPSDFESRILARPVSAAVQVPYTTAREITRSANGQNDVRLAHGAGLAVVVWHEENRVYANRITADGRSLDGRGISLGTGYDPAVAFDGKQFVVAFSELGSQFVALQFISPTEGLLHDVLRLRDVTGVPTVAEGGVGVLVAAAYGNQVSAAMVDRNLRVPVVTAQLWKLEYPSYVGQLRAAWNGKEFFVAWTELEWRGPWAPYTAYFQRILGGRVNTNLFMLDTQPRVLGDAGEEGDRNPALASDGNGWLVSWQFNGEVRARRIGGDGVPNGDDTGARIASGVAPALAFDGTQYVVAWKGNEDPREVRVASETRTGALDSLTGTVIVATFLAERIEIVPTGLKTFAIVYSRISDPSLGFVPRAFVQRLFSPARRRSAR